MLKQWWQKLKNLWTQPIKEIIPPKHKKTLAEIEIFDDVWLEKENSLYKGWILDKTLSNFIIVYSNENKKLFEINVPIKRPLDRTMIEYNGWNIYFDDYGLRSNAKNY